MPVCHTIAAAHTTTGVLAQKNIMHTAHAQKEQSHELEQACAHAHACRLARADKTGETGERALLERALRVLHVLARVRQPLQADRDAALRLRPRGVRASSSRT